MYLIGHRPVIVKREVIGPKVDGSSAQILSCKVFRDWSLLNKRGEIILDGYTLLHFWKQHLTAFVDCGLEKWGLAF